MEVVTPSSGSSAPTFPGLVVLYAPNFQELRSAYPFATSPVLAGRDPSASVCVPQIAASRSHARFELRGEAWWIVDLGGRNGTIVDGVSVREAELEDGSEVRIGDTIFKFVDHGAEGFARYRIDGWIEDEGGRGRFLGAGRPGVFGTMKIDRIATALERIAQTPISVVLLGESGTGKEVLAQHLHRTSERKGPLSAINCAAIPANLLESELFGYKRGAFSGADRDKVGLVRAAHGGTLFLDEIGDMQLEAQAKLLRVLQSKEVLPVGAVHPETVDVRVVCATHRDLRALERQGKFRGDLYARLGEFSIRIPPLRERKEDVYLLAKSFLERHGRPKLGFGFPFMTALLQHDFPFNVRELESIIKRAAALCDGATLEVEHLPEEVRDAMRAYGRAGPPSAPRASAPELGGRVPTEEELRRALGEHRGNVAAVGRIYGKERMQVHRWMRRYGIDPGDFRK